MAYADYSYYEETYLGDSIPEAQFPKYAKRASEWVDYMTFNRIERMNQEEIPVEVKEATCAVADRLYAYNTADSRLKASESNDGYSVSYRDNQNEETLKNGIREAVYKHLMKTGLLYRGICDYDICES